MTGVDGGLRRAVVSLLNEYDKLKPKHLGYQVLDITRLHGYSYKCELKSLRKLVYAVDQWIENHTNLISEIKLSTMFASELYKETGRMFNKVETVVGDAKIVLDKHQSDEIIVL